MLEEESKDGPDTGGFALIDPELQALGIHVVASGTTINRESYRDDRAGARSCSMQGNPSFRPGRLPLGRQDLGDGALSTDSACSCEMAIGHLHRPDLLPSNFCGISCDYRLPTSTTAKSAFTLATTGQRQNDPGRYPAEGPAYRRPGFRWQQTPILFAASFRACERGRRHRWLSSRLPL
jgi:hypothetical protein